MSDKKGSALGIVIALVLMAFFIWLQVEMESRCQDKGGVYLMREGKCVTGLKELE